MTYWGSRIRQRVSPGVNSGSILGQFYRDFSFDGTDWRPVESGPILSESSEPYVTAQRTIDDIHPGFPFSGGGPFLNYKVRLPPFKTEGFGTYSTHPNLIFDHTGGRIWKYVGGFGDPIWVDDDVENYSDLELLFDATTSPFLPSSELTGPEAYARVRPHLQKVNLAVATAELRDLPRMLQQTSQSFHEIWKTMGGKTTPILQQPKKLSEDFLNTQFGWIPFVSDIQRFSYVFSNAAAMKGKLIAQNNKWFRRRWTREITEDRQLVASGDQIRVRPAGNTINQMCDNSPGPGRWKIERDLITTLSAVGSFKYYRPEFDASLPDHMSGWSGIQRDLTLYGARINPSNVYKATPWSWLLDWGTSVGDSIDHFNDAVLDGVVNRYTFVMQGQQRKLNFNQVINFRSGAVSMDWSRYILTKTRQPAGSPFGFHLSGNLTPRQLAILAALGLSKDTRLARGF
jgi:hypothetical protein